MTKTEYFSRKATSLGYHMNGDSLISPSGRVITGSIRIRKSQGERDGYVFIHLQEDGSRFKLPIHRMIAFQKYGDYAFKKGVVTRHKDGNSLNNNPDNIVIGTVRDNIMDRSKESRVTHSRRANCFPKIHMSKDQKLEIVRLFNVGMSQKKISKAMGISRSTIGYLLRNGSRRHGIPPQM